MYAKCQMIIISGKEYRISKNIYHKVKKKNCL